MQDLRTEKGWTFPYAIYQNTEITRVPMIHGIFKAKIYLPNYDYDEKTLRNILEHESTHFRMKDNALIGCFEFFFTVYWFIPYQRKIRANLTRMREYRCDAQVLSERSHQSREEYIHSIYYIINKSKGVLDSDIAEQL